MYSCSEIAIPCDKHARRAVDKVLPVSPQHAQWYLMSRRHCTMSLNISSTYNLNVMARILVRPPVSNV